MALGRRTLITATAGLITGQAYACAPLAPQTTLDLPDASVTVARDGNLQRYVWPKPVSHTAGAMLNGLTLSNARGVVEAQISTATSSGEICIVGITFIVRFAFEAPIRILLREQLDPSGCAYAAVYRHEEQHVTIAYEARRLASAAAAHEIVAYAHTIPARHLNAASLNAAIRPFTQAITERMMSYYDRVSEAWNRSLDSAQSYAALQSQCLDWR